MATANVPSMAVVLLLFFHLFAVGKVLCGVALVVLSS